MKRLAEIIAYGMVVLVAVAALALFATLPEQALVTTLIYRGF